MGRGRDLQPRVRRSATDAEKARRAELRQQSQREKRSQGARDGFSQLFSRPERRGEGVWASSSGITSGRDTEGDTTAAGEDSDAFQAADADALADSDAEDLAAAGAVSEDDCSSASDTSGCVWTADDVVEDGDARSTIEEVEDIEEDTEHRSSEDDEEQQEEEEGQAADNFMSTLLKAIEQRLSEELRCAAFVPHAVASP